MNQYRDDDPNEERDYLDSKAAAQRLGVRRDTLYAYVSRGLIRSEPSPGGRGRRYRLSELERFERRREQQRQPSEALAGALDFGGALLESQLTCIEGGRFYYRGRDACELSRSFGLERTAAWLWLGDEDTGSLFDVVPELPVSSERFLPDPTRPWTLEALQAAVPWLAHHDPAAVGAREPSELAAAGARLLLGLVRVASGEVAEPGKGGKGEPPGAIARTLLRGWRRHGGRSGAGVAPEIDPEIAAHLVDTALVLSADHELNVSSFTARCVASAGSTPYSVVSAGLAALQGHRHGGHTRRMAALVREALALDDRGLPDDLREVIEDRRRRGEEVPGFGQRLYPNGDPRYLELRDRVRELVPGSPALLWADALERAGRDLLNEHPTLDAGLVLVGSALGLPRAAPLALFALGRTVGWIAHAIEQIGQGQLIRPRARYTGPAPHGAEQVPCPKKKNRPALHLAKRSRN